MSRKPETVRTGFIFYDFFASAKFLFRYLRNRNLFIFELYIYLAFYRDKNELDRTYIYRDANF